ncbi:alginate lyase family protein [Pedobacter sp. P351]|uniref:alginate lyase family protein n=1 Tax=Pedobacter superstes TaxID=3133441 RepID=UPI0030971D76
MRTLVSFSIALAICTITRVASSQSFSHPGILHSKEDLERMKIAVAEKQEPIYSGFKVFAENPVSKNTYKMQGPMAMVGRNPTVGQGTYDTDANAAHQNAVMWAITGEKAYAEKAKEIVNAWSSTLKSITGRDAVLMAGLGPFKMVNAAEILRYTNASWSDADIKQTEKHFKEVIYPVIKDFAPFANGNWDAAAIKTVMAIGVFCNDRLIYERALRYYVNGHGNGRLSHYIINQDGQIQESGRDQGHTQLGIGMLAESSEIAWHQGLNLYGYADNLLLKGFEYVAKFNLGNEVPFVTTLDHTGKYFHQTIARQDRGPLRAVYEQVYNHYVNRIGLPASFTQQAAEKIRPEGPGRPGADHPGYGTLFFTRSKENAVSEAREVKPASPGAIIASGSEKDIQLTWVESIGAQTYTVKRAAKSGGLYKVIASNIANAKYTDKAIKSGRVYYYTVSASNEKGHSSDAMETGVSAGPPDRWSQKSIGTGKLSVNTGFDGKQFTIEGAGMGLDSLADQFHYTYQSLKGNGSIVLRFVPQPSSQFSSFGVMIRDGFSDNSAYSSLIIYPGKTSQIEALGWHLRFMTRQTAGSPSAIINQGTVLSEPTVTYGRLTGYYWLKLERKDNTFTASGSADGKTWTESGKEIIPLKKSLYVGIQVSSGIKEKTTTVFFDNLKVYK